MSLYFYLGSAKPGSALLWAALSAPFALLLPPRLSSAPIGTARLGSAPLGSARLGATLLGESGSGTLVRGWGVCRSGRLSSSLASLGSFLLGLARQFAEGKPGYGRFCSARFGFVFFFSALPLAVLFGPSLLSTVVLCYDMLFSFYCTRLTLARLGTV